MEEYIKYLMWLGLILAIIGPFTPAYVQTIAIIELLIGIIVGVLLINVGGKDVFNKAVFYSVTPAAMAFFTVKSISAVMTFIKGYLQLMAWIYVPAGIIYYLVKVIKEGF